MDEQYKAKLGKSRILVMYGYHIAEVFAPVVVEEVKKQDIPNTRFIRFPNPIDSAEDDKDPRTLIRRRFIRQFLPVDYVLDIHDSPDAVDTSFFTIPACGFRYLSKQPVPKRIVNALTEYTKEQSKLFPDRYVEGSFSKIRDRASKYDKLSIEFMPHYITKEQSVNYLSGLLKVLSSTPRRL